MSKIEVDQVDPQSGTTLTLGTSGDTVTVTGNVVKSNAIQASDGGNLISQSGTTNTIGATGDVIKTAAGSTKLEVQGDGSSVEGKIQLNCHANSHGVILQSPPHSSGQSWTLKLPENSPTADKFIKVTSISGSGSTAVATTQFAEAGGGDMVLLSSTTPSAANTFSIDGHFTSDYDIYKIYAIGMSGSGMSNTRLSFRVNVGGTAQTGGSYYFQTVNSSKTTLAVWADNTGGTSADLGYVHSSSGSTKQGNLEMTIFRPLGTDVTGMLHEMLAWDNGTDGGKYMGSTFYNVATAISGITLGVGAFGSGNIEADRILVYGMKNS